MIEFHCKNCGQKLSVQDQHSGKRVKCPKCGSVGVVPDKSDKIKFNCQNCGQSISVPQIYAGKKGKCPKCKNVIIVPTREAAPSKSTGTVSFTCSMCDEAIQVPETSIGKTIECPECGSYIETSSGTAPGESDYSADEDLYEEGPEEYEDSEGVDRHLIVVISSVVGVVVVGLIILAVSLRSFKSRRTERPQGLRVQRQVADTDSRPKPVTPNTQPEEPVPLEDRLYKQTKIAFESRRDGNYDIYVMNADGSEQKRLTKNRAWDSDPSWSPDGKKIVFRTRAQGNIEIYVMNADGSEHKNLTNNPASDWDPSWSPDGKKIAFSSKRDGNMEIYVMNSDGSEQKNLTNNPALDRHPSWSPDGTKIAFCSMRDGNPEIYITNADGSEQIRLTNNRGGHRFPSWSPDGKKIAFSSQKYGFENIYVMNADGSEQRRLTNNPADEVSPSWSPDGKKIVFQSDRDGLGDIYVMNADGSEQKRLTDNPSYDKTPSWSPFIMPSVAKEESQKEDTQLTEPVVQETPSKADSGAKMTVKLLDPGAQPRTALRYKFQANRTEKMVMETNMAMAMEIGGQKRLETQVPATRMTMSIDSNEVSPEGDLHYEFELEQVEVLPKPGANPTMINAMKQQMSSMQGLRGSSTVTSRGLTKDAEITPPPGIDLQNKQSMDEMKQSMNRMSAPLPEEPVGRGASWQVTMPVETPAMKLTQVATYTLMEIRGDKMKFDVTIKQSAPPQEIEAPGAAPGMKASLESLKSSGKGTIELQMTNLIPTSNLNMTTSYIVSANNQKIKTTMRIGMKIYPKDLSSLQSFNGRGAQVTESAESDLRRTPPDYRVSKPRPPTASRTESPLIGKQAPSFTLRDLSGKRVSLSDFKGKVVILDFWATWCPPCVVEIPHFIAFYEQYKDQGFAMVGISTDRKGVGIVRSFAQKYRINYPILMANGRVQSAYGGISAIPTTFVIDSEGIIRHKYIGYRDKSVFETAIKALLADIEP